MAKIPEQLQQSKLVEALFKAFYERAKEKDRRSNGVGLSTLGDPCERNIWYNLRWASPIGDFEARMRRLFERGNQFEPEIVELLRSIGCTVYDTDPATGQQFRVEKWGGHLSGYLDGVVLGVPEAPKTWHTAEFKTHNAKSFREVRKHGVKKAKPAHYAQMMAGMGLCSPRLERAVYIAENKDDSDLYSERIKFDGQEFIELELKAERIIFSDTAPERVSNSADKFPCMFCQHKALCHQPEGVAPTQKEFTKPELNCRTCAHITPRPDGTWFCEHHKETRSKEQQEAGCEKHLLIPDLLPWEATDADESGERWIEYQTPAGKFYNVAGGEFKKDAPF